MTKHCETRRKVRAITTKKEFNDLLEKCILTEGETALMRMHYLDGKDFRFIGDKLGFSEQTMKVWHHRILERISCML